MQEGERLSPGARESRRVFLAFAPDPVVRKRLDALACQCHERAGGRRIPASKLHLTLLFVGQARDAQVEAIAGLAAARSAPKVSLLLDRFGFWERGGIVWAGCRRCPPDMSAWVEDLHERARRMGFSVERREFKPHITLLRDAHRHPGVRAQSLPWTLTRLCLYESHISSTGSDYRELYSWPTAALM